MSHASLVVFLLAFSCAALQAQAVDAKLAELVCDPAIRAPQGDPTSPAAQAAKELGARWLNPFATKQQIAEEMTTILALAAKKKGPLVSLAYNKSLSNAERRAKFVEIMGKVKQCPKCDAREPIDSNRCRLDGMELIYIGAKVRPGQAQPEPAADDISEKSEQRFPGFTFLQKESFTSGNQTHEVEIFSCDKLVEALALEDGAPAPDCEFVLLPKGSFTMGTDVDDKTVDGSETPQHPVTIQSFLIARTEVTQRLWEAVMKTTVDEQCKKCAGDFNWDCTINGLGELNPMYYISWEDSVAFCEKVGLRLPSEAEWEYACRAGTTTLFSTGDLITTDLANYRGDRVFNYSPAGKFRRKSTPVATFPANAFGLFDMHGNVWEWVQDSAYATYHGAPLDGSARVSREMDTRIYRGGSFATDAWYARSARRSGKPLGMGLGNVGFRPATR